MKFYNTIIIDDELASIKLLTKKLGKYFENVSILETFQEPELALSAISKLNPDFILLDIEMPRINGFEFLKNVKEANFEVIFITAYDQYAIEAFEHNAIGYLLKPVNDEKFVNTIQSVINRIEDNNGFNYLANFMNEQQRTKSDTIAIPSKDGFIIRRLDEILRIESINRYAVLFFTDGTNYISSYNIGKYREQLNSKAFLQTHKSHIVAKSHIRAYLNSGSLELSNGALVPISANKKREILDKIR